MFGCISLWPWTSLHSVTGAGIPTTQRGDKNVGRIEALKFLEEPPLKDLDNHQIALYHIVTPKGKARRTEFPRLLSLFCCEAFSYGGAIELWGSEWSADCSSAPVNANRPRRISSTNACWSPSTFKTSTSASSSGKALPFPFWRASVGAKHSSCCSMTAFTA